MDTYEKKYKEALEKAQKALEVCGTDKCETARQIFSLFPELRESEDERVRKEILSLVRYTKGRRIGYEPRIHQDKMITWLEKQSEQKLANKVEPWFQVGDWVVTSYGKVNQVIAVDKDGDGFTLDDDTYFSGSWKDGYHLWTIKDAKDGDVLAAHECYVIFKEIDGLNIKCYFSAYYMGSTPSFNVNTLQNKTAFFPATKEQRDTLMKAMADAGYTFDFDKKELRKIVAPKFKIGDTMRTLQEASNGITSGLPVIVSIDNEYYHCNNELIAIKDQDNYEYPPMNRRQNLAWSEEDEKKFSDILAILRGGENCYYNSPILIDWLKSLKQRIGWKPSEEQIECLHDAINHYQTNGYPASKLNELYEQMSKIYKL